jgi:putrescine transport system ATP-binding protein
MSIRLSVAPAPYFRRFAAGAITNSAIAAFLPTGAAAYASGFGVAGLDVPELAVPVHARCTQDLAAGDAVTLAVRPEKIAISRERPDAAANVTPGVVEDLGYFGKDSLYRVRLPSGRVVSVNSVNARRAGETERVAQWEDAVWLAFDPTAAILLRD